MEIPKVVLTVDYKEIEIRVLALLKFKEECIGYIPETENNRMCVHFQSMFGKCRLFRQWGKPWKTGEQYICDDVNKGVNND